MLILKNATLMTMTGAPIVGDIAMESGRITGVGSDLSCPGAREIDLTDRVVTPGLIDAHTHIGMLETGTRERDHNENSDPITPEMRAIDAIYPNDTAFLRAREAGVTSCVICPGSINLIGGTCAAIKTIGKVADQMAFRNPIAMKMALGENPKFRYSEQNKSPKSRMASAALIRRALVEATEYQRQIRLADGDPKRCPPRDLAMEALLPVLDGELTVKIHVHRMDDIATAIRIMEEFHLTYTLDHCTEGHLIPECILEAIENGCRGVITGPLMMYRGKRETANAVGFALPRLLHEKGIPIAICTDYYENPVEMLRTMAALAVTEGLQRDVALSAITSSAAKISGIDDRVGQLKAGLDADLAVFTGDPMEYSAQCIMTIINGNIVFKRGEY